LAAAAAMTFAAGSLPAKAGEPAGLTIDIPVVLKDARIVFNMDHLAFDGDEPFGLDYMRLMVERFTADKTDWKIFSIFHGPAGYMLLGDAAYDKARNASTGNP